MICCLLALLAAFPGVVIFRTASAAPSGCRGHGGLSNGWGLQRDVRIGMSLAGLVMAAAGAVVLAHAMIHGSTMTLLTPGAFGDAGFMGQICSASATIFNIGHIR